MTYLRPRWCPANQKWKKWQGACEDKNTCFRHQGLIFTKSGTGYKCEERQDSILNIRPYPPLMLVCTFFFVGIDVTRWILRSRCEWISVRHFGSTTYCGNVYPYTVTDGKRKQKERIKNYSRWPDTYSMWTLVFYKVKGGDIWSVLYYGLGSGMCVTYALI